MSPAHTSGAKVGMVLGLDQHPTNEQVKVTATLSETLGGGQRVQIRTSRSSSSSSSSLTRTSPRECLDSVMEDHKDQQPPGTFERRQ
jgi:hypothetical protein